MQNSQEVCTLQKTSCCLQRKRRQNKQKLEDCQRTSGNARTKAEFVRDDFLLLEISDELVHVLGLRSRLDPTVKDRKSLKLRVLHTDLQEQRSESDQRTAKMETKRTDNKNAASYELNKQRLNSHAP